MSLIAVGSVIAQGDALRLTPAVGWAVAPTNPAASLTYLSPFSGLVDPNDRA